MFVLQIETKEKNKIRLTQNEDEYQIIDVSGLGPVEANIIRTKMAGYDGSLFNTSVLNDRNIVITIKICGNIEKNRLKLYKYFRNKQYCKIYYQNQNRNVYIEGYVESFEVGLYSKSETAQISIICPDPFFKDIETVVNDISKIIAKFKFPFSININNPIPISELDRNKITNIINNSETETGLIIECNFLGNITKLEIRNTTNGEAINLNYNFIKSDKLTINCNKGNKEITLIRESKKTNLIPYLEKGSKFLQLAVGENNLSYLANNGENDSLVSIKFKHYNRYGGV